MMPTRNKIELLAPAADFSVAKAAIDAGADAVYMGGPAFGARVRASNSLQDIEKTVRYAHRYASRVFLTLNTLIYEDEMPAAVELARQAYNMGVDALLIQDLGLLEAGLPPIELHASTQCHIDSVEKALFLQALGFKRLVLARELSLREIAAISKAVKIETEAFIHGALCVSYSGQCYMSCYTTGRSGNRGECSQACRLPYDLVNGRGEVLLKNRYLLSMKDLNADAYIEDLVKAGVSCLKIEGRLKEVDYVKNVTYWYRKRLDAVLRNFPTCVKASQGEVQTDFQPDLQKTFHREYTSFNLSGKREDWAVFETPKAMGCRVGKVRKAELRRNKEGFWRLDLQVEGEVAFSSGDGICYVDARGDLQGGNVERVEKSKGLFLLEMAAPSQNAAELPMEGTMLYRNRDKIFDKTLQTAVFSRTLAVHAVFDAKERCFSWRDEDGNEVRAFLNEDEVQPARNPEAVPANFAAQTGKLGGTAYRLESFEYKGDEFFFVPASTLNRVRRDLVEKMNALREERYRPAASVAADTPVSAVAKDLAVPAPALDYRVNCANSYARRLYSGADAVPVEPAYELEIEKHRRQPNEPLMLCKHCIRAQVGQCLKRNKVSDKFKGDLFLRSANHKFALRFDCEACRMEVRSC